MINLKKLETDYIEERTFFDKTLKVTGLISLNQHGIKTDGRGIRAMKIFTRQTLTGISLDKLLPRQDFINPNIIDFWDISSIASLARNLVEGFLSLHFFGLEKITEEEAELRFFILQLHRNTEWYSIRRKDNPKDKELVEFENGISKEKQRIKNHIYLKELTDIQRNRALRGIEIYKTKADFEQSLIICENLRGHYQLLSNLIHPLPLSTERIDNEKGRGERNELDMLYSLNSMRLARRFLAASTVGIVDHFPSSLYLKFKEEIESIRPLINKGFEE